MDLSATKEIALPIAIVWQEVTHFEQFEEGLRRREVTLERSEGDVSMGTSWTAHFPLAGRTLKAKAHVVRLEAPHAVRLEGQGTGIDGYADVRLEAASEATTRITLQTGLKAKAIGAQVILQPLRLARGKLQGQLDAQLERIARGMEQRHDTASG